MDMGPSAYFACSDASVQVSRCRHLCERMPTREGKSVEADGSSS